MEIWFTRSGLSEEAMRQRLRDYAIITYLIALVFVLLAECAPPACLPIYVVLFLSAVVLVISGRGHYRVVGVIALVIAVAGGIREVRLGKQLKSRIEQQRK
jgi:hypothetical protein